MLLKPTFARQLGPECCRLSVQSDECRAAIPTRTVQSGTLPRHGQTPPLALQDVVGVGRLKLERGWTAGGGFNSPRRLGLARTNADSPWSLLPALHFKLDVLSLFQTVEIELLEAAAMEENLLSVSRSNETKAAITNNSLDCTLHRKPQCA